MSDYHDGKFSVTPLQDVALLSSAAWLLQRKLGGQETVSMVSRGRAIYQEQYDDIHGSTLPDVLLPFPACVPSANASRRGWARHTGKVLVQHSSRRPSINPWPQTRLHERVRAATVRQTCSLTAASRAGAQHGKQFLDCSACFPGLCIHITHSLVAQTNIILHQDHDYNIIDSASSIFTTSSRPSPIIAAPC